MGVVAVLSPRPLVAQALTIAGCELRVTNTGSDDDEYKLQLLGDAAPWGFFGGLNLAVPAGGDATTKVLFRLPRAPTPPAGPLPFSVRVTSLRDQAVSTVAEGVLEVGPFSDVSASLQPRNARSSGPSEHDLMLVNRGNGPVRAGASAGDPDGHLDVVVEPSRLEAPAGGTASAKVRVTPRRRVRGREVERPFRVVVTPDGGEAIPVDGSLIQEPVRRSKAVLVGVVVLGLLLAGGAVAALTRGGNGDGEAEPAASVTTVPSVDPACPAQGHYNRNRTAGGGLPFNFSFLEVTPDGCQPVRFNPCQPIHYIVNPADSPPGGVDDVHEAFRRIAAAGGYTFVDDGTTTSDRFDLRRLAYQPDVYGERWAPIVVSWSHLGNRAASDVVVAGMGQQFNVEGVLVTGMLNLNADARSDLSRQRPVPDGFGKGISWGKVMLHELGHVFGLGHVESKGEIMHEELLEQTLPDANWGVGDLVAWRLIGQQAGCVQTPAPHPVPPLLRGPPPSAVPPR